MNIEFETEPYSEYNDNIVSLYSYILKMRLNSTKLEYKQTRRERLKSAPYLRLKKRKTLFLEKN